MQFIGIDLHTNRFTCRYRDGSPSAGEQGSRRTETFGPDAEGLAAFCGTPEADSYVLVEATITTFSFVRLIKERVKEAVVANTHELKQISLARCKTDKPDADKPCRIMKAQVLSGEQLVSPATVPPQEIRDLRGLFATYRLYRKQAAQLKNRVHSLLKERLHPGGDILRKGQGAHPRHIPGYGDELPGEPIA